MMPDSFHYLRTLQTKLHFYDHAISANRHGYVKYVTLQYSPNPQSMKKNLVMLAPERIHRIFFLEHAGELRIIALIEEEFTNNITNSAGYIITFLIN
jgi:hypothetical protein